MSFARSGGIYSEPPVISLPAFPSSSSSQRHTSKPSTAAVASGVSVATPASHKKHTRVASVGKSKKELAKPKKAKPSNGKLTKPSKPSPNGKTPVKAKKAKPSPINKKTPKTKEPKKTWHILNNGV